MQRVWVKVLFWEVEEELRGGTWLTVPAGATLADLFHVMVGRYPRFAAAVEGNPRLVLAMVDGVVRPDLRYKLAPDVRVVFYPALAGG
ncbi:MoaD/ThiS family protein [Desulfovirgula thermocuniculi]|uniref:MoaD/ThiS family protein n=1 Tax=Desulfovirgula thermocuniculi TaxID=348842 RepID=UPI00040CD9AF|nr:MoaD/ThiS family protein [Desulfovirgula thermocuniculi]